MQKDILYVVVFVLFMEGCTIINGYNKSVTNESKTKIIINKKSTLNTVDQEFLKQKKRNFVFSKKSIWKFNSDIYFKDWGYAVSDHDRIIESIKESGGTIEAVQAAEYLSRNIEPAYVSGYQREGLIDILYIEYPTRANENSGIILVPAIGKPIDIEHTFDKNFNLSNSLTWKRFSKNNPVVLPYSLGGLLRKEQNDKGIKLIFPYALRSCHGCDDVAFMDVGYSFTNKGEFIGSYLSGIRDINR
ncbi:hypothetical protein [Candidatus Liberibacter americanus]|uniref:Uncharacterized protein n=1 Tax=Candidatus Liberibacter americanus str. Sao Paulo TaxID=1261131 RepID=U6B946_9HYPH|nr:hypothetical protein [Candidatus Liberibacter americanus]AHA28242.1 hypothetical protein lam_910 [Candidatus Liberibacter americanus str. Sao Paulo]EMS36244.1 hypothetical protein G653_02424 [Candidatus Liberibacter americanus PW_SP]